MDEILFYYQNDRTGVDWTEHAIYVKDFGSLQNYEWYALDIGDVLAEQRSARMGGNDVSSNMDRGIIQ